MAKALAETQVAAMRAKPLALSLGDPAGIGPELICAAWDSRQAENLPPFCVVGGNAQLLKSAAASRGLTIPITEITSMGDAASVFDGALPIIAPQSGRFSPGNPTKSGATMALASLEAATEMAVSGKASAVVTGPVSKAALAQVGFTFPGQTEYVAHASGIAAQDGVMMLAGPQLRAVPMTVHCALSEVSALLSVDLITRRTRIIAQALARDFAIAGPRIALTGLNPHAGEDGRMGREEIDIIAPAIAQLQSEGIAVTGPHPADALFAPHARGDYDVAVAMYHDQALIPLKALDFDSGVNMTLGLPIIRTSADHGTAFAIAGQGKANAGATLAALRMAGQAAANRAAFAGAAQ